MNPIVRSWPLDGPLEIVTNTAPTRTGGADPTGFVRDGRVWRASRQASGPAVVACWTTSDALCAQAWGPGAADALAGVPDLVGLTDPVHGFRADRHPLVADMHRRRPGVRLPRTGAIFDAGVRATLGQKVTGLQAKRSYCALVRRVALPAPLARVSRRPLFLPPAPRQVLDALAGHGATTLGIDVNRAAALRELALVAHHLEELDATPAVHSARVRVFLEAVPGIGAWTANEITLVALGDPDAVSVGDFHLKNIVSFALADEPRGTDERMLELLDAFRPHRARAVRLVGLSGVRPPRYGPRMDVPAHVPVPRA